MCQFDGEAKSHHALSGYLNAGSIKLAKVTKCPVLC